MNVVLATGSAQINSIIGNELKSDRKVQYLEELKGVADLYPETNAVVVSTYLPSIYGDDTQKHLSSFKDIMITVKNEGIRVVVLTDSSTPYELLEFLYQLGVYDLLVSNDGLVDMGDIMNILKNPLDGEAALKIITKYKGHFISSLGTHNKENEDFSVSSQSIHTQSTIVQPPISNQPVHTQSTIEQPYSNFDISKSNQFKAGENNKIFAFWGQSDNVGKRSLSLAFASELSQSLEKVLYVELDYVVPSFALTTGLSNPTKNLYQLCLSQDQFDLNNFVSKKTEVDLMQKKGFQKVVQTFPDNLHFLTLPISFQQDMLPTIDGGFVPALIQALRDSEYNVIVLNLPTMLENIFSFPVMLESDKIIHVIKDNIIRIEEYNKLKSLLKDTPLDLSKWNTLFNMVGEGVPKESLDSLISEKSIHAIPYDPLRSMHEMDLQIGSPAIQEHMKEIINVYGLVQQENQPKKKRVFGLF